MRTALPYLNSPSEATRSVPLSGAEGERNGNCGAASDERLPHLPSSEIDVRRCIHDPGTGIADARADNSSLVYDSDDASRLSACSTLSQLYVAGSQQLNDVEASLTASLVDQVDEECRCLCTASCTTSAVCNCKNDSVGVGEHQTAIVSLA